MNFKQLRKKYPRFIYQNYSHRIVKKNLEIFFTFKIEPDIEFKPKVVIKNIDLKSVNQIKGVGLDNLIFHLGLIELLSYWKATCSAEIKIEAGYLNEKQILWWKNLIFNGLGQFFYENEINFKDKNFLKITTRPMPVRRTTDFLERKLKNRFLVAIGGGKDSIVTLESLKKTNQEINCFALNPNPTINKVIKTGKCLKSIIVQRTIDKKLLILNKKGFLNGHTPFSAYLAFLSVLLGIIFDYKNITLSNERSSNEGNVKYLGKIINHQYSKSFDFEKNFRDYSKKYLAKNIEYFSFLRPLYEIQIAQLFSNFSKYFPIFLSCNEAHKTQSGRKKPTQKWCCNCAKCLFVFMSLHPFIETEKLINIFGQDLFENKELLSMMKELIGEANFKPFECVGTRKESLVALYLSKQKIEKENQELPYLLKYFEKNILPKYKNLKKESQTIMDSWDKQNNLPKEFWNLLKLTK
ncbi:MAG: hypothetical protein ABH876_00320 [Patescibacteria group bacterium]|nr:hypothetical protein [Patescibacteria group bacterium]